MTEEKKPRPTWDEYFMEISRAVGKRGTCDRGMIGVVIVKDKRILGTGYVGSPVGIPHCDEVGHQMKKVTHEDGSETQHCMRTSHAEINAICNAARYGVSIDGATIYGKFEPCHTCAKAIINAGIKRVVCEKQYHAADDTRKLFKLAGIDFVVHSQEVETYANM
jgi:dCMP deaminase